MRAFNNGCFFTVCVSAAEVDEFNYSWPCSTLNGPQSFMFAEGGDLVDRTGEGDGPEALALAEDAQTYGRKRLKLIT